MDRPIDHACLELEVWQEYPEIANILMGIVSMDSSVMGLTSILGWDGIWFWTCQGYLH